MLICELVVLSLLGIASLQCTVLCSPTFKTVEQNVCGIRHFLRYLLSIGLLKEDFAEKIHMPPVSRSAKIPSAWPIEDLKAMISTIDRKNPIGKRDYAMIVLACILGLRIGDIKALRFSNFDWNKKTLSLIQNKTHKPLTLPLPDTVGWAVFITLKMGDLASHTIHIMKIEHIINILIHYNLTYLLLFLRILPN